MENNKLKPSGIVGVASRHAGALVGAAVVTGKKFGLCVRSMMTGEPGPSDRLAKKPVQVRAKKKTSKTGKKKAEGKGTKIKKKTEKPKRSSRPQSRPTSKAGAERNVATEVKMSSDKSGETKTPTDSVS